MHGSRHMKICVCVYEGRNAFRINCTFWSYANTPIGSDAYRNLKKNIYILRHVCMYVCVCMCVCV